MATWVIGDIHGCLEPLLRLVDLIDFEPGRDRLWLLGDLVNRGPDSLGVLRWVSARRESVSCIVGNHDLKLLACDSGVADMRPRDTFGDVLTAPDRQQLVNWLARQPLLARLDDFVLVHAGVHPSWTLDAAGSWAQRISEVLAGSRRGELLAGGLWKHPGILPDGDDPMERLAAAAGILTGIRIVDGRGIPDSTFTGPLEAIPEGYRPWYAGARLFEDGKKVLFGHWAQHGPVRTEHAACLDSACLYGGALSAMRLEDGTRRSVPCPRYWPA